MALLLPLGVSRMTEGPARQQDHRTSSVLHDPSVVPAVLPPSANHTCFGARSWLSSTPSGAPFLPLIL